MAFGASSSFSAAFMRGGHGGHNVSTRQLFIWIVTALLLGVCGWSSGLLVTYALDVTMMTASPSPSGAGSAAARSPAQKQSKKGKKGNAGSGKAKPAPAAQKPQAVPRPLMHTPVVTEQAGVHDDEEAIPASTQEPDTPAVVQTRPTAVIGESDARKEHAEMEMLAKEHGSEDDTKVVERTADEKVGLMTKEQLADILRSHGKGGGEVDDQLPKAELKSRVLNLLREKGGDLSKLTTSSSSPSSSSSASPEDAMVEADRTRDPAQQSQQDLVRELAKRSLSIWGDRVAMEKRLRRAKQKEAEQASKILVSKEHLIAQLRARGLPTLGSKVELAERLRTGSSYHVVS
ncbi:flavin-containing monooxygenase [Pycnococcus provasolii]